MEFEPINNFVQRNEKFIGEALILEFGRVGSLGGKIRFNWLENEKKRGKTKNVKKSESNVNPKRMEVRKKNWKEN